MSIFRYRTILPNYIIYCAQDKNEIAIDPKQKKVFLIVLFNFFIPSFFLIITIYKYKMPYLNEILHFIGQITCLWSRESEFRT